MNSTQVKKYSQWMAGATQKAYNGTRSTIVGRAKVVANAAMASGNMNIQMLPQPGGAGGIIYIQRPERTKTTTSDTTAAHGTRLINRLNNAQKTKWTTATTIVGAKRDFLIQEDGDKDEIGDFGPSWISPIQNEANHLTILAEETAIANILADTEVTKISLGNLSTNDIETIGEKVFTALVKHEFEVANLVDKYVHMSMADTHLNNYVAKALRKHEGGIFNVDKTQVTGLGIIPQFSLDQTNPGYVNEHLNKFVVDQSSNGGVADEAIVAIIIGDGAYVDSGIDGKMKPMDTTLLDEKFRGHSFYGFSSVVDSARIRVITAKLPVAVTHKVEQDL